MAESNAIRKMPDQIELIAEPKKALTPAELLTLAISRDADIDKLQRLMELQERWEANEARKAFVMAMKRFKDNPPLITKNKRVHFDTAKGPTDYVHATLDHVCDAVTKCLSAVGITHTWKVDQHDGIIAVSCVLTHEMGHSESTQLFGSPDLSGSKNGIQAIGSTVTYLQRYTLLSACGLAASNDNDGQTGSGVDSTEHQKGLKEIAEAKTADSLKFLFAAAYNKAQEANDYKAMAEVIQAKDAAKKRITCQ